MTIKTPLVKSDYIVITIMCMCVSVCVNDGTVWDAFGSFFL